MTAVPESTYLVWYCRQCRHACKVQPQTVEPSCKCATPVPSLRPTRVTVTHEPKIRQMHAVGDAEADLRRLILARARLRITYEADIAEAWTTRGADGTPRIQLIVTTPDGRRHPVDTRLPGVHIEAAPDSDQETSA